VSLQNVGTHVTNYTLSQYRKVLTFGMILLCTKYTFGMILVCTKYMFLSPPMTASVWDTITRPTQNTLNPASPNTQYCVTKLETDVCNLLQSMTIHEHASH
jgi:hypothetical protein